VRNAVTISIQLEPEVETSLLARARAQGMTLDAFVQSLVKGAAVEPKLPRMSDEEFEAAIDELAEGSENWPVLPPEATTREGIYEGG
jgi:hypothetical protein